MYVSVCIVFFNCRGQLKLGDFGLARLYHADDKRYIHCTCNSTVKLVMSDTLKLCTRSTIAKHMQCKVHVDHRLTTKVFFFFIGKSCRPRVDC